MRTHLIVAALSSILFFGLAIVVGFSFLDFIAHSAKLEWYQIFIPLGCQILLIGIGFNYFSTLLEEIGSED